MSKEDEEKQKELEKKYSSQFKNDNLFEIHHISVSAGDATVIAAKSDPKKTYFDSLILIDAGNSKDNLALILGYCNITFAPQAFKYIILSHDHDDHRGYLPSSDLLAKKNTTFVHGKANESYFGNTTITKPEKIDLKNKGFDISFKSGFTMTCCCAGGVLANKEEVEGKLEDENDLSLAWILEYKGKKKEFRYFTAGDLSGSQEGGYTNVESPLLKYLRGSGGPLENKTIDVLKATHHGSKYSLFGENKGSDKNENSDFLNELKPEKIIVPCNNSLKDPLPTSEFFKRAKKYGVKKIWIVNEIQRPVKKEAAKSLDVDFGHWKDNSNLVKIKNENNDELYSNTSNLDELPVYWITLNEDGDYDILKKDIDYTQVAKSVKIDKGELLNLPKIIPDFYFKEVEIENEKVYPLIKLLMESEKVKIDLDTAKKIEKLYKKQKDTFFYEITQSSDFDSIKMLEKFEQKHDNILGKLYSSNKKKRKRKDNQKEEIDEYERVLKEVKKI